MSFTASVASSTGLALLVICAVGCGGSSPGVPVQGHVSYQGEAISSGTLTFFPASGRPISTILSSNGEYTTRLQPGEYRVTITVGVDVPAGWEEGDPLPPPKFVLPARYTTRSKDSLKLTVVEKQQEPFDFALE